MKQTVRIVTLLSLSAATLLASGYRIPEQSLNSVALSAAYVAGANGADASYYNPANMSFMENGAFTEVSMTYINLPQIKFTDNGSATLPTGATGEDARSTKEEFLMPNLHYVSPMMGNWRYGLSITAPAGLSKRWTDTYQKSKAEEFTLKVIEVNPTVSYKFNDQFSGGFGLRGVYTDGVVTSNASNLVKRDLAGDSIDFGYNLALSYKPIKDLTLAATYRSKVDLTVTGSADMYYLGTSYNNVGTSVTIPLPASLALAAAYTMNKTTVEFVFERTYWSSYKELDFNYDSTLSAGATASFDTPVPKNWKDVNAYRIGVSHQYSDALKLMAGFAIDKTPVPNSTLGFELPDSDAKLYSVGFEYKINQKTSVGLAYLYDEKETRTVDQTGGIKGTFTDASAHLVTASFKYKF